MEIRTFPGASERRHAYAKRDFPHGFTTRRVQGFLWLIPCLKVNGDPQVPREGKLLEIFPAERLAQVAPSIVGAVLAMMPLEYEQ